MTLEEQIRDAAARGELSNLSIAAGRDGKTFTACFAPASTFGCVFRSDPDPVKAMTEALKGVKLARRRKVSKPTTEDADADDMDFG